MRRTIIIDALPEQVTRYRDTHALVIADVFRATTTMVTALASGRRVYPTATIEEATQLAPSLAHPLLAGEQAGIQPDGFELNNSPSMVAARSDRRPLVLISSSGTRLLVNARAAVAVYVACFRNLSATASHLAAALHPRIALIGAGTKGEPRAEDQIACAWIGQRLLHEGFEPENAVTVAEIARWDGADIEMLRDGPSADYLRRTGQEEDIDFVLSHVDDLDCVAIFDGREVKVATDAGDRLRAKTPQA